MRKNPLLRWFDYKHLPEHLREVSRPFWDLAYTLDETLHQSPQLNVALQKLIEAKDAAVRAAIECRELETKS